MDNGRRSVLENHLNIFGAPRGGADNTHYPQRGILCKENDLCGLATNTLYFLLSPCHAITLITAKQRCLMDQANHFVSLCLALISASKRLATFLQAFCYITLRSIIFNKKAACRGSWYSQFCILTALWFCRPQQNHKARNNLRYIKLTSFRAYHLKFIFLCTRARVSCH